jgi:hypothetical protein
MGNAGCTLTGEPYNLSNNYCALNLGDYTPDIPGVCSAPGFGQAHPFGDSICRSIGTEFVTSEDGPDCFYNTCTNHALVGPPSFCCNNGCCSAVGFGTRCERTSFSGDTLQCCLNDMMCTNPDAGSNPPQCYSDAAKTRTCSGGPGAANNRSIVSTACEANLYSYCTGTLGTDDPNSREWLDRWTNGTNTSCPNIMLRKSYRLGGDDRCYTPPVIAPGTYGFCRLQPDPGTSIDAEGYFWSQRLLIGAIAHYRAQGYQLGSTPGFSGYHPFQDFLYDNVCCPYPGLCQAMLRNQGEGHSVQQLSGNPELTRWFGCYLPEAEYEEYSAKYNIQPACSPTCNRISTIPEVGINDQAITCTQSVCIIDNVTANLLDSTVAGGVSIDQICAGCAGGGGLGTCACMASDVNLDITNSTINGLVVPLAQICGNYTCQQSNPSAVGPAMVTIPCDGTGNTNPYEVVQAIIAEHALESYRRNWIITIIIIVVIMLIIIVLLWLFHPQKIQEVVVASSSSPASNNPTSTNAVVMG